MSKIFLKYLYIKTLLNQKVFRDGSFPYKNYHKLTEYVEKYSIQNALECGTAVGLTAASILLGNDNVKLDTIERHRRSIDRARENIKDLEVFLNIFKQKKVNISERVNFVEGLFFDMLEMKTSLIPFYDMIFLDGYVSRYNEVVLLSNHLKAGGIFVVSNIRPEIFKSKMVENFLLNSWDKHDIKMKRSHNLPPKIGEDNNFEFLERVGDTIFVRKL